MRHINLSNTEAAQLPAPVTAIRFGLALAIAASLLAFAVRANSPEEALSNNSTSTNPPVVQLSAGN